MTETADLLSIVLTLRPTAAPEPSRPLPAWWGRAAQSALLQVISAQDAELAKELHAPNSARPYTSSTLMGRFPEHRLDPDGAYALRYTVLTSRLAGLLEGAIQPGGALAPGAVLELDYLPFTIQGVATDPTDHPWAGRQTFAGMGTVSLLSDQPERRLALQITSPATFHSAAKSQPLPLPELVFGSLIERWNAFAPLAFPVEARHYAAKSLAISRFELKSRAVAVKDEGLRIGAVGQVIYTAVQYDRYWMSLMNALADFALYAGVGAGTGMGLGQCRRFEPAARA